MRRSLAILIPVSVLALAGVGVALALRPWETVAATTDDAVTAVAERTTLTSDLLLNGTLDYGDVVELPGRAGTITRLPSPGTVVAAGQELYEVDGRPVVAIRGDRPFWRALDPSSEDGADVQQLEQALADLGFGAGITVDESYTWATAQAVKAWQRSLGVDATGIVQLGDVVAISSPAVRVATVLARLGDSAGASPLRYTSTVLGVRVSLTDAQARELLAATPVTVRLPDRSEVAGTIAAIDPGGQPTGDGDGTTSASARVELEDPTLAEGFGLRAVKVVLASETVDDALVVPVTALVATLDGGYAVDVLDEDGTVRRVDVEVGLVADTRAQVVGGDLAEGDVVVVAP